MIADAPVDAPVDPPMTGTAEATTVSEDIG